MKGVYFEDEVRLARFLAELCREGMAFKVEVHNDGWLVTITGF